MIKVIFQRDNFNPTKSVQAERFTIVQPNDGPAANNTAQFKTAQLNDANEDYLLRKQYHHTEEIKK